MLSPYISRAVLLLTCLVLSLPATAHELWIDWKQPDLVVSRGHAPDGRHRYDPQHVQPLRAFAADGTELPVQRQKRDGEVAFRVEGTPAIAVVHSEWGQRVQTTEGKRFMTRSSAQAEGLQVLKAFSSTHHAKSAFVATDLLWQSMDLRFELVLTGESSLIEQDPEIKVRLLFDGKPVPNAAIHHPRSDTSTLTNAAGEARIRIQGQGQHLLLATHEIEADADPELDVERHMTFLTLMK